MVVFCQETITDSSEVPNESNIENVNDVTNVRKLQMEVSELEDEIAIERKFRSIESNETSKQIEDLMKLNDDLSYRLNQFKLKQKIREAVHTVHQGSQTENTHPNIVAELESIREKSILMKQHYDELVREKNDLANQLIKERKENDQVLHEMMTEQHLLGRRNTDLMKEVEEIKLKKYSEVDIDFTQELRVMKFDYGEDIKAIMNEMHKLLIENKILKFKLNDRGINELKYSYRQTQLLQLKEELFRELDNMKNVYNKDHTDLKQEYDAVSRERKNLVVQVKEQKAQLLGDCQRISDLQRERKHLTVSSLFEYTSRHFQ